MAWVKLSCTCLPPQTCLSVLPEVFMWHPKSLSVQIVAIHLPACSLVGLFYRRASSERLHLSVKLSFVSISTLHLLKGGSALFLCSPDIYGLFPLTAHSSQVGVSGSEPVKVRNLETMINIMLFGNEQVWEPLHWAASHRLVSPSACLSVLVPGDLYLWKLSHVPTRRGHRSPHSIISLLTICINAHTHTCRDTQVH